ncbi:MAG: universal stress protein [Nocardioidaceae bacterium]
MNEQQQTPTRRVVVGVDGSPGSVEALRWGARVATALGATVQAVTAWHYPTTYGAPMYMDDWRPDVDAEKVLEQALDEAFGAHRPPGLVTAVAPGTPREVLLEASKGAQLLVVGSRGHGGFTGLLLGSVSAAVAEHAGCAVLVARGEPTAPASDA